MELFDRMLAIRVVVALMGIALFAHTGSVSAQEEKTIVVEAQKIRNETEPFKIELWTHEGETSYHIDDEVVFFFKAQRDCFVTLIDIGTSGKVTKLFPNKWQQSNKVQGGQIYRIPPEGSDFILKVRGPTGMEFVKAIATLQPVECVETADVESKGNFQEFKDPAAVVKNISIELAGHNKENWAETSTSFEVKVRP